jgi:hypothetical protein
MAAGVADPATFGGDSEQLLSHHQTDQLDIRQTRLTTRQMIATPPQRRQDTIIEVDVECGQKGVKIVLHKITVGALRPRPGQPRREQRLGLIHLGGFRAHAATCLAHSPPASRTLSDAHHRRDLHCAAAIVIRRWFAPAPIGRIAPLRALVYLYVPIDVLVTGSWVRSRARLGDTLDHPLLVARLLHLPAPTVRIVVDLEVAIVVTLLAAATGRAPRTTGSLAGALYLMWMLIAMSYGKVDHDRFAFLVALAVLPTVGRALASDRSASAVAGRALRCIQVSVVLTYFSGGVGEDPFRWVELGYGCHSQARLAASAYAAVDLANRGARPAGRGRVARSAALSTALSAHRRHVLGTRQAQSMSPAEATGCPPQRPQI